MTALPIWLFIVGGLGLLSLGFIIGAVIIGCFVAGKKQDEIFSAAFDPDFFFRYLAAFMDRWKIVSMTTEQEGKELTEHNVSLRASADSGIFDISAKGTSLTFSPDPLAGSAVAPAGKEEG